MKFFVEKYIFLLYNKNMKGGMRMSSNIEFRKHRRDTKRKMRNKNFMMLSAIAILIAIIILIVVGIFGRIGKNNDNIEFIYNGYVYPQLPERNSDIIVDVGKSDGVKKAYLTFDDGPNYSVTTDILDILRRYNIKATFFMVGTLMEHNQGAARRVYDEGHLLANHSYSHKYSELYASTDAFMNQINHTQELIYKITDNKNYPKVCRFPGGGYNSGYYGEMKKECKVKLEENGYRYCDWNALTGDAESANPSADSIMSRLKKTVGEKEDVVILMHDAPAKSVTAKTLPDVIDYLIECGYEFDTLDKI